MSDSSNTVHVRDRSLGLVVFGSIQILIGLACLALVPLTLLGMALSPSMDFGEIAPSLILTTITAAALIVLGTGSIRARRWAQALSLSLAWVWLITGVCTLVLLWLAAPSLWLDLAAGAGLEGSAATAMALVMNLILAALYIVLPGAMVGFFRSPHVVATCRRRDAQPNWASRTPQRLLSLAVSYVLLAVSIAAVPSYGFVFPVFGILLSGLPGAILWAAVFVSCVALAVGTVRRRPWAWWTAVGGCIAAAVSSAATFARVAPEAVFAAMDLPTDQLLVMEFLWPREPWIHVVAWLAIWGSLLIYLVVVRPLFGGTSNGCTEESGSQAHVVSPTSKSATGR